jgi:hypothetical protein
MDTKRTLMFAGGGLLVATGVGFGVRAYRRLGLDAGCDPLPLWPHKLDDVVMVDSALEVNYDILVVRSEAAKKIIAALNDYDLAQFQWTAPADDPDQGTDMVYTAAAFDLRPARVGSTKAGAYVAAAALAGFNVYINVRLTNLVDGPVSILPSLAGRSYERDIIIGSPSSKMADHAYFGKDVAITRSQRALLVRGAAQAAPKLPPFVASTLDKPAVVPAIQEH